jgi:uncharacterized membrane protein
VTVKIRLTDSERFLRELSRGLEVLGPAESREVVVEVGTHLVDAVAEAGGDEAAALSTFGSPQLLATRILQERGALSEGSEIREAPASMRWAAVALDGVRWLILLFILLGWAFFVGVDSDSAITPLVTTLACLYVAVVVGGTLYWWVWRRRASPATAGMAALGLRRVTMGSSARIVRERDVPGTRRSTLTRATSLAWSLILVLIFVWFSYGLVNTVTGSNRVNHQQEIQEAVQDASQASLIVQNAYMAVSQGQTLTDWFGPTAAAAAGELAARYAANPFTYLITDVQLPDYKPILSFDDPFGRSIDAYVTVVEFREGGATATYKYKVVYRVTHAETHGNSGFFEAQNCIEEVTPL